KKNPDLRIEIRGHTDRTFRGPEQNSMAYNQKLSEIRSASVRRALVEGGIDTGRLITVGKSYLEPEESETSAAGRDRNRRVEFRRLSLDK
ncbi:MAG TPA: OmpA family protein, partial [Leptospiraceae bacterium]|nr:OmpA family protein [Leptospiraceae bacterium]